MSYICSTTTATLTGTAILNCVINSDSVSLTGVALGDFSDANVGDNKTVSITGLSLGGTDAGNYNLSAPFTSASILKANQTITFNTLGDKVYTDVGFGVSATASSGFSVNFTSLTTSVCTLSGNTVSLWNVGTCVLRASQAGDSNYNPAPVVDRSFTVTPKALTVTGIGAVDKVYDGTISAILNGVVTLNGVINSDSVGLIGTAVGTFNDANAGDNKMVLSTTMMLS